MRDGRCDSIKLTIQRIKLKFNVSEEEIIKSVYESEEQGDESIQTISSSN